MANVAFLNYKGQEETIFFESLSGSAKSQLLELKEDGKKVFAEAKPANKAEMMLEKGYITFQNPDGTDRVLKISTSKKGKFIRISDTPVYLDKILAVCEFCETEEENSHVRRRPGRVQKVATFLVEGFGAPVGKEFPFKGNHINTNLGSLRADELQKRGVINVFEKAIYKGYIKINENSYYNYAPREIVFNGMNTQIACQVFNTDSLKALRAPLEAYLEAENHILKDA